MRRQYYAVVRGDPFTPLSMPQIETKVQGDSLEQGENPTPPVSYYVYKLCQNSMECEKLCSAANEFKWLSFCHRLNWKLHSEHRGILIPHLKRSTLKVSCLNTKLSYCFKHHLTLKSTSTSHNQSFYPLISLRSKLIFTLFY